MRLKLLLVHNRYREPGGEDAVVDAEAQLLEQHGHEVIRMDESNVQIPDVRSLRANLGLAGTTIWSKRGASLVGEAIRSARPDLIHFHNTFPLLSPAAYRPARLRRIAVVQSLHNYRLLCPNAFFFRDGSTCEDCIGKIAPWPGVFHACYRGSHSQAAAIAAMLTVHRMRGTWKLDIDHYITPTDFARSKFIQGGLPADRIAVKPNFPANNPGSGSFSGEAMLFVGRLVDYKGIYPMLRAWTQLGLRAQLRIVGDGPLVHTVRNAVGTCAQIEYFGRLSKPEVLDQVKKASAVLVPSLLYETFGTIIAESYSCGTPVIASRLGAMAEIVEDGVTGLLFEPGNAEDLAAKVRWAHEHPAEMRQMGENARREYEAKYTPERNYAMLMDIYEQAIEHARQRRHKKSL